MISRLIRLPYQVGAISKCNNSYILRVSNNKFELGFSYKITSDFKNIYDIDIKEGTFKELPYSHKVIKLDNDFLKSIYEDLSEYYSGYEIELKGIYNRLSEVSVYDEFNIYTILVNVKYTEFNIESDLNYNYIEFLNKEM